MKILARQLWHFMSSPSKTGLVAILFVCVAPSHIQGLGVMTPHHSDVRPGCSNRLHSYALLRSWTMFAPRLVLNNHRLCPVNLGHIFVAVFMWLQSCRLCCDRAYALGCAVSCSHIKWAYSCILQCACIHSPFKPTWTLMPKQYSCLCRDHEILPLSPCEPMGRMPPWK